ncbi:hypothetical protein QV08_01805 [Gallibacterium salpingitidis]|uniref:DUF2681 domain-containing protein n=1 Tax=Gallibacterium salpingitidis TaxID=505341 RepID=A0AB36E0H1_9PAST|nr:DUF2681 domain-containing protein [Gallibacterium salpingitidis]OBX08336.1 hypothetical protein QV09_09600 [Gallibacterium salpingitidis]OBX09357.1 hypothetical protein QV08_01805 [Gallibacterium salpingitidis]
MSVTIYLSLIVIIVVALIVIFLFIKVSQAKKKISEYQAIVDDVMRKNAAAQAQINNHQERVKNEEKARVTNRDSIIDSLHQAGDLRDE